MEIKSLIEIFSLLVKILSVFFKKWFEMDLENKKRYSDKIKISLDLLSKSIEDKMESINESDYSSNLDWEKKQRYDAYLHELNNILNNSNSDKLVEISKSTIFGMDKKFEKNKIKIEEIINQNISYDLKAKAIAKIMVES